MIGSVIALATALADFFESRAALFASESKTAAMQFLIAGVCVLGVFLFFVFGYIFLIAAAVVAVAHLANVSWVWIALDAAALHILIALVLAIVAISKIKRPVFRESAAELKKDREWLRNLDTNQRRS